MTDPDFNLLIALDALLTAGSVAGAARRLGLSASAMSRTLSRLRTATGDPLLVRAGRHMVLTPYAETLRERARNAAFEARAVLRPAAGALDPAVLDRTFTLRANDGFVEAFGPALIAAAAEQAPRVRLRFAPKPEKSDRPLREGLVDLEIGVLGDMGPEIRLQALFRDRFVGVMRTAHPLAHSRAGRCRAGGAGAGTPYRRRGAKLSRRAGGGASLEPVGVAAHLFPAGSTCRWPAARLRAAGENAAHYRLANVAPAPGRRGGSPLAAAVGVVGLSLKKNGVTSSLHS